MVWLMGGLVLMMGSQIGAQVRQESVTFFVHESAHSNRRIARNGVLVTRDDAPATVVILHGYTKGKYDMAPLRLLLKQYNSLIFDFRGHGDLSLGQRSTLGHDEVYDVFAAVDYVRSRPDLRGKPVFAFAFSMGAATAIEAQALDPQLFDGLFLDTPFSSSVAVLKQGLNKARFNLLGYTFDMPLRSLIQTYAFDEVIQPILQTILRVVANIDTTQVVTLVKPIEPAQSAKKITVPTCIVACEYDTKVPARKVRKVWENLAGPKRLHIVRSCRGHCDIINGAPEWYDELLNTFFADILAGRLTNEPVTTVS